MLSFEQISWTIKNRRILNNISAKVKPNKLTAIMGGSGAGKTSLFKILSGRTATKFSGKILINDRPISKQEMLGISGYVYQSDILPRDEYVQEYLEFVSELKVGHKNIDKLFDILGLNEVRNSIIGDANSGISGGQKKRLSIAVELIGNPEILFLDEPTSGLDVFSATKLIKYLKQIEKTSIISIHQPSAEIFNLFDDVIILKDAKIFYKGPTKDFVPYLKSQGFIIPEFTNPADYLFTDVLPFIKYENKRWNRYFGTNIYDLESDVDETERGIERLLIHKDKSLIEPSYPIVFGKRRKGNFIKECLMLITRYFLNIKRNRILGVMRLLETVAYVLTIAPLFYKISKLEGKLNEEVTRGFHYTLVGNGFWAASLNAAELFFYGADLFIKEYRSGLYSLLSYYVAKNTVSITFCTLGPIVSSPIFLLFTGIKYSYSQWILFIFANSLNVVMSHGIGIMLCCMLPNSQVALLGLQIILLPLSSLSGMVCVPDLLIAPLWFLQYFSPARYVLYILLNNHYIGEALPEFIKALNKGLPGIRECCLIMIGLVIILNVLSYFSLSLRIRNKY
ncbi:ATP-binding cassette sub-family G member 1 [Cucumispora dikerogammari]|nr:ATP-binding cassette sub-family G member 1 [Cucumispora dikerogammari]